MSRLFFWFLYRIGRARWDTGIVPPEIAALIEGEKFSPGRAIDLGCGTGVTSIYLAQHGWEVVGIDFIPAPIRKARVRASRAGISGHVRFIVGDVRHLRQINLPVPFDLAVDIGCGHAFSPGEWRHYAEDMAHLVRPGGLFLLYVFRPTVEHPRGITLEQVEEFFASHFRVIPIGAGSDQATGSASAWYRLERVN